MGCGHFYTCRNCGETGSIYLDVGMAYPEICREAKLKAVFGKMGKRLEETVRQHPEGAFDCSSIIYACECGGWRAAPRMDYFIMDDPKSDIDPNNTYCSWEEIGGTPIYKSRHLCPKCRKKMHPFPESDIGSLPCPKCGGTLEFQLDAISWD